MSESKEFVKSTLRQSAYEMIDSLLRIYAVPDHPDRKYWEQDIYSLLSTTCMLKSTGCFPSSEQIYRWTYGSICNLTTHVSHLKARIESIEYQVKVRIPSHVVNTFNSFVKNYFQWLAEILSNQGAVSEKAVVEKLDDLCPKDWDTYSESPTIVEGNVLTKDSFLLATRYIDDFIQNLPGGSSYWVDPKGERHSTDVGYGIEFWNQVKEYLEDNF